MNKRMREILAKIEQKTAEAKGFASGENKDVEKATSLMDEVDELKKEFELEKRIYEQEKAEHAPTDDEIEEKHNEEKEKGLYKRVRPHRPVVDLEQIHERGHTGRRRIHSTGGHSDKNQRIQRV